MDRKNENCWTRPPAFVYPGGMRHYNAYGGPQPPPIDHQGIDDAFLEKASVTWYCHDGTWLKLTGAD